jgi:hypothetical protein
MDQDSLALLSAQDQEMYLAHTRRFATEDWQALMEWCKEQAINCSARELMSGKWEDILVCRGEKRAYEALVGLEQSVEMEYQAKVDDINAKRIAELESEYE